MKVIEIQKSNFGHGYRAIVIFNGKEQPTVWFKSFVSLKASLKSHGVIIPDVRNLRFISNGFDASFAVPRN